MLGEWIVKGHKTKDSKQTLKKHWFIFTGLARWERHALLDSFAVYLLLVDATAFLRNNCITELAKVKHFCSRPDLKHETLESQICNFPSLTISATQKCCTSLSWHWDWLCADVAVWDVRLLMILGCSSLATPNLLSLNRARHVRWRCHLEFLPAFEQKRGDLQGDYLTVFITRCVLKGDVSVKEGYRIRGGYFALFIALPLFMRVSFCFP